MKSLHFSVPSNSAIHQAIAEIEPPLDPPQPLESPDHLSCFRLLTEVAERLADSDIQIEKKAATVHAADVIMGELAHDERVQRRPSDYFGIRFLQAEARSACDEYHEDGDSSGIERFRSKLKRDLRSNSAPPQTELRVNGLLSHSPTQSLASEFGRLAMFLLLLLAAVVGVVFTGMFAIGIGH